MNSSQTETSTPNGVENELNLLDSMKFSRRVNTRASKKRKDNPVEIKYEQTPAKTEANEVEYDPKDTRKNFEHMYALIKEMRKEKNAAVDFYGCVSNADKAATREVRAFHILVSLLISVQNRDESTGAAMERFKARGLTVENINSMGEDEVLQILGGVNFNKTKAKNIKAAGRLIADKYNGRVPEDWDELLKFPGVGNKVAVILLNKAFDMNAGIGVDTHVHRVANRLGWAKTKLADQTRVELERFVPKKYWNEFNKWLVGFGQQICQPINPKCDVCLLNRLCPEGRKRVKEVKEEDILDELQVKRTKKVKDNKVGALEGKEDKEEKSETVTYVKKQRGNVKKEEKKAEEELVNILEETMIEDVTIDEDGNEQEYVKKKVVMKTKTLSVQNEYRVTFMENGLDEEDVNKK